MIDLLLYSADENDSTAVRFLHEFGQGVSLPLHPRASAEHGEELPPIVIFRLSDEGGVVVFQKLSPPYSKVSLSSDDVFLVDAASSPSHPTIYIWIGKNASLNERRLAIQYAQRYLYENAGPGSQVPVAVPIARLQEGYETAEFLRAVQG